LSALFVSDLHLSPARPAMAAAFAQLLRTEARTAARLYILGDLFDYWIGDDDLADPFHAQIAAGLAELAAAGCRVGFMPGNRDFLLGERFAAAAGLCLLPDPSIEDIEGTPTVLMHGDTLCVDDVDYMAFRAEVRASAWQRSFLDQPLAARRAAALQLRARSAASQEQKAEAIMDVAERAVVQAFRDCGCTRMIHGHTHRPGRHEHRVDGRRCERWVLADWYGQASYLRCDATGCTPIALTTP
jgi:UDP-2,3-diacylglucosamine hydrolase